MAFTIEVKVAARVDSGDWKLEATKGDEDRDQHPDVFLAEAKEQGSQDKANYKAKNPLWTENEDQQRVLVNLGTLVLAEHYV